MFLDASIAANLLDWARRTAILTVHVVSKIVTWKIAPTNELPRGWYASQFPHRPQHFGARTSLDILGGAPFPPIRAHTFDPLSIL